MRKFILLLLLPLTLSACRSEADRRLEVALEFAGANRAELEQVLAHYAGDSLKQEAARFLIENMVGSFAVDAETERELKPFYQICDTLCRMYRQEQRNFWRNSVDSVWDVFRLRHPLTLRRVPLLETMSANRLIEEIDLAFAAWQENVFTRDVTFDEFCEYILPPHKGDCFVADNCRTIFRNRYGRRYYQDRSQSVTAETTSVLHLYKDILFCTFNQSDIPALSPASVMQLGGCTCEEKGTFNALLLSALGMPVTMDFVPVWGNREGTHSWNVLLSDGRHYAFDPFGEVDEWDYYNALYGNRGLYDRKELGEFRLPKVYRKTYSIHLETSLLGRGVPREDIPLLFLNFKKRDVSKEYFPVSDVEVCTTEPVPQETRFAFLSVFSKDGWCPVQFGELTDGKVRFADMGRNIVYLPVYYKAGRVIPAAVPLWLKPDGSMELLDGKGNKEHHVVLRNVMVRPLTDRMYLKCMDGAAVVATGKDGISDTVYHFNGIMPVGRKVYRLEKHFKARSVKLCLPSDTLALGELAFWEGNSRIEGLRVGSSQLVMPEDENVDRLFDCLTSTCFQATVKDRSVTVSWQGEREVTAVEVAPFTASQMSVDCNFRLYGWLSGKWTLLDEQRGNGGELVFNNVPGRTLLRLEQVPDKGEKKLQERVFLYRNGDVIWM